MKTLLLMLAIAATAAAQDVRHVILPNQAKTAYELAHPELIHPFAPAAPKSTAKAAAERSEADRIQKLLTQLEAERAERQRVAVLERIAAALENRR